jgi:hypothetical protein
MSLLLVLLALAASPLREAQAPANDNPADVTDYQLD